MFICKPRSARDYCGSASTSVADLTQSRASRIAVRTQKGLAIRLID